ncbi:DUF4913 domain-containing protein [Actinomadura verrucosospora]|uniref:DUF4913 domain-containing protein n=1 Tax=Actinomadura verrucosospora TaxID=46165 RepID=A0A7D3VQT7_ACTVE|nr:DUF4913 domain-containing protein [Actinomadura verrucosospora]QKG20090.1 hypothetical protein ACTIVE_1726 [Actinomadura verrucosospora]
MPAADTSTAPADQKLKPLYPSLSSWVSTHFVPMYRRTLGGEFRWCAQWWHHGEAISRLTALWYAWEAMRLQGATGMALWYRDHLDHQLPVLLGPRGPFYQCTENEHLTPHEARVDPAPAGWLAPDQGPFAATEA